MKKTFTLIIVTLFTTNLIAQTVKDSLLNVQISDLKEEVILLTKSHNKDLEMFEKKLEFQQSLNEQTISSISIQLDSASYNLTIFGIIFGVLAIILGVYITFVERKIVEIFKKNEKLLSQSQSIKQEVEELNELIHKDIYGLFHLNRQKI